jgi:hypothetical protein
MSFKYYFSWDFLYSPVSGSSYEKIYLFLSVFIITLVICYRLFLFIRGNRPLVYKKFDSIWFWGYLALGLSGLFIWFSRTQALPFFSTRLVSYLWILLLLVFSAWVIFYLKKEIPQKIVKYTEQKRKAKYLKK